MRVPFLAWEGKEGHVWTPICGPILRDKPKVESESRWFFVQLAPFSPKVMDGRFVPNITIGPGVVSALRKAHPEAGRSDIPTASHQAGAMFVVCVGGGG